MTLHRKYGSDERIIIHCETVTKVAKILADAMLKEGKQVDVKAVLAGAMLHDIGRSRVHTVRHGLEGANIVEGESVEMKVVEIVRKHVGAGISREEARALQLPDLDYIPTTLEEMIVCFADKMVDADRVRPFEAEVYRFTVKGHDVSRLVALKRRLQQELGEDPEKVIFDKVKETR